jgi:single-strand DNA-binding protein
MLNRCDFIGRLGSDPESRYTQSEKHVCTISLAVQERKDGPTEWVRVVMWDKLADIAAQYLSKGSLVYISGRLQQRKYEQDGQTKYSTEIVAYTMKMLGGGQKEESPRDFVPEPAGNTGDLPF